jgi:tRNA(His) 5'-end guanylyltransferase
MPVNDELGKRMKENYENVAKTRLMRRTPVAIRIDGKAFHTYTRGFKRPFDTILIKSMQETTKYLCENIQGCILGYTQSDEITLILVDYRRFNSSAWFDYEVEKLCSVAASMATMAFNQAFTSNIHMIMAHLHYGEDVDLNIIKRDYGLTDEDLEINSEFWEKRWTLYQQKMGTAMFDARCFNIPKEEVTNLIYWRQLDATRNSIQMVGQAYFSQAQLEGKNQNDIQEMLWQNYGINWNDFPTHQKRGTCVVKNEIPIEHCGDGKVVAKLRDYSALPNEWIIDTEIPIFKGEGREYIEQLVQYVEEQ